MSKSKQLLKIEYEKNQALASQFAKELNRQIDSLVEKSGVKLGFPTQNRVKTWGSIDEKIDRLNLKIKSIEQLQDLVGLRLTLVFLRDVEVIKSLFENTFDIIKSYNTSDKLKNDQFGYSSFHMLIKCPESWSAVPSLAHLKHFQAEIQIRTLAQHIWAEVSHQLQYKNENNVPNEILRSIYRSSALLETIDLEFERVLSERESYRIEVKSELTDKELNINSDNLDVLLDELLPSKNKDQYGENYSLLISDFNALGIKTVPQIRNIITSHFDSMLAEEAKERADRERVYENTGDTSGTTKERIKQGVFYTFVGLVRQCLAEEFGKEKVREVILATHKANKSSKGTP